MTGDWSAEQAFRHLAEQSRGLEPAEAAVTMIAAGLMLAQQAIGEREAANLLMTMAQQALAELPAGGVS